MGLLWRHRRGVVVLIEPVMALELDTPAEHAGRVLGQLQQKRGRVEGLMRSPEMK